MNTKNESLNNYYKREKSFAKEYYDYDELVGILKTSSHTEHEIDLINKAYELAEKSHAGQKRKSGVPYILHPTSVAYLLCELGMDASCIATGLLHDVVEDTKVTIDEIRKEFGEEISNLVDGVTKLSKLKYSSKEEQQAENVRKMFMAMGKDIRVIIIKLADRTHNMRTIGYLSEKKRNEKAKENMEIYAPIADRLGMYAIKEELEDLSLRYVDPKAYDEIKNILELKKVNGSKFVNSIIEKIKDRISTYIPDLIVTGRVKSITSIYKKMFLQGKTMEQIYDIYAVRIIVDTVADCYNALGFIHDMFTPIPNRFKDYISTPKPNMYQSLHTTVISKEKVLFEVQIRTKQMHHTAEYGIATHWKYKLGPNVKTRIEEHLSWINKMMVEQNDIEFLRDVKSNLTKDEVFVLTPKGDVITLPQGATVIDFAYAIHTQVGHKMTGAKVDKRIVPINYVLSTGEIVDILTTKSESGPKRDWLKTVKTGEAKNKIKQWFKKEKKEENIEKGKEEVEKEFKQSGINLSDSELNGFLKNIAKRQNCDTTEDLYATIGYGGINLLQIMPSIKDKYTKLKKSDSKVIIKKPQRKNKNTVDVEVEGVNNCLVKLSPCCSPIPGDDIIGYITRGYGVTVHKRSCVNVPDNLASSNCLDRWVKVRWANNFMQANYNVNINVKAKNRVGMLADITLRLSTMNIPITSVHTREYKGEYSVANIGVAVNGLEHLSSVISRLYEVDGIISVTRG